MFCIFLKFVLIYNLTQFRYATWYEILATIFGMLMALVSGGAVSYNLITFGELSTLMVQRTGGHDTNGNFPLLSLWGGGRKL